MRKLAWLMAVLGLFAVSCDSDSDSENTMPQSCTADYCKDSSILVHCYNGYPAEEPCTAGSSCIANKCVLNGNSNICTADVCLDASTLQKCINGTPVVQACSTANHEVCEGNQCIAKSQNTCTADVCLDASTLQKCVNGTPVVQACSSVNHEVCEGNQCVVKTSDNDTGSCKIDKCKDKSTMSICENGQYVDYACGTGRICKDGACVAGTAQAPDCLDQCVVDPEGKTIDPGKDGLNWDKYHACVNGNHAAMESSCNAGQICLYGGCTDSFSENDSCEDAVGTGFCTADLMHAVVCGKNGKKTIWTCKAPCSVQEDGIVDCPKEEIKYEEQCPDNYQANCYNDNNNVHVCIKHQIVSWECYQGTCSVDAGNQVFCPKNAGIAGLGGIESGGTYGDMCNVKTYQEECIDKYYARICDEDGYVRIKPAGDCKISSTNPKKVEFSTAAVCDTSNYMPFCINNGQAIGFCAYDNMEDLSTGIYKAAQCPNCSSEQRAEECMYL